MLLQNMKQRGRGTSTNNLGSKRDRLAEIALGSSKVYYDQMVTSMEGAKIMQPGGGNAPIVLGTSIETNAGKKKRIASSTVASRVKFTMQPYHQRVCSNRNIKENGIVVLKPDLAGMGLGVSQTTTTNRQTNEKTQSNSLVPTQTGKYDYQGQSNVNLSQNMHQPGVMSQRVSRERRPKSTHMYQSTNRVSTMYSRRQVGLGKTSGNIHNLNQQSQNLNATNAQKTNNYLHVSSTQEINDVVKKFGIPQATIAKKDDEQIVTQARRELDLRQKTFMVYEFDKETHAKQTSARHTLQKMEFQNIAQKRAQAENYLFSKYDNK